MSSAEPKLEGGAGGEAAALKKSSKKSSKKQPAGEASAPSSAPPPPTQLPAGPLPLPEKAESKAQPQAETDVTAKKKSSKKKPQEGEAPPTSTAANTPPLPLGTIPAPAKAPESQEGEEERKRAALEAKKERARKAEEEARKRKEQEDREKEAAKKKREQELKEQEATQLRAIQEAQRREEEQRKREEVKQAAASAEECDEDEGGYEEDFEAYEDDEFEADEEGATRPPTVVKPPQAASGSAKKEDVEKVKAALQMENAAAKERGKGDAKSSSKSSSSKIGVTVEAKGQFETVVEGQRRAEPKGERSQSTGGNALLSSLTSLVQKLDPKVKRAQDLQRLLKLSDERFPGLDLRPLTAHDLYTNKIRAGEKVQTHTQTGEDSRTIGTVTETPEQSDKDMQFPDDLGERGTGSSSVNMKRVTAFLQNIAEVVEVLLEENVDARTSGKDRSRAPSDPAAASLSSISLFQESRDAGGKEEGEELAWKEDREMREELEGRRVADVSFSPSSPYLLVAAYQKLEERYSEKYPLRSKSILTVWDVNSPIAPSSLADQNRLVLAGSNSGTIELWDLREPKSLHSGSVDIKVSKELRRPTFTTAMMGSEGHQSAICGLLPLNQLGNGRGVIQVASLDDRGILIIWSVVELQRGDMAGSESDLGLSTGGRVKLLKTAAIDVIFDLGKGRFPGPQVACMDFVPGNANQYVVGTLSGSVIYGSRFGGNPTVLSRPQALSYSLAFPSSVKISPFYPDILLIGWSNGDVSVHMLSLASLVLHYDHTLWAEKTGEGIVSLQWSPSRPAVFFASTALGDILAWDLKRDVYSPCIHYRSRTKAAMKSQNVISLSSVKHRTRQPCMVRVEEGTVIVGNLSPALVTKTKDEEAFVQNLFKTVL